MLTADLTAFKESCRRRIRNVSSDLVLILGREVIILPSITGYKPGRSARICDDRQPCSSANFLSLDRIRRYCEVETMEYQHRLQKYFSKVFWFVASLYSPPCGRYGSSCELVIAVKGQGVHGFTLDSHVGEFVLTRPYMKILKVRLVPPLHTIRVCTPA